MFNRALTDGLQGFDDYKKSIHLTSLMFRFDLVVRFPDSLDPKRDYKIHRLT